MKKLIVLGLALLVVGAVSARAADAKELWAKNCAKCHGEDGKGKTKMGEKLAVKDYTDAKVQGDFKDPDLAKAIKEGVKDGGLSAQPVDLWKPLPCTKNEHYDRQTH